MGGEGDLEASPGGALARRTARPRGARGSSLLSSHISPVWPVSYVWRAVGQRAAAATGPRGGAAMGGEGDLKAAPGGARARRTGRPRGARGSYLLSSHISPVWPVSYVWRAVAQRAAAATGPRGGQPMGGEGDLKAAPGEGRARRTACPRGARGFYLLSSHISPVWPVSDVWRAVAQRAAAATGPRGGQPMGGEGDLKAAPGEGRARRTGRPHGARGSSLLSSHISPVWPVSYVWRAVGQRAAAATGPRGGRRWAARATSRRHREKAARGAPLARAARGDSISSART